MGKLNQPRNLGMENRLKGYMSKYGLHKAEAPPQGRSAKLTVNLTPDQFDDLETITNHPSMQFVDRSDAVRTALLCLTALFYAFQESTNNDGAFTSMRQRLYTEKKRKNRLDKKAYEDYASEILAEAVVLGSGCTSLLKKLTKEAEEDGDEDTVAAKVQFLISNPTFIGLYNRFGRDSQSLTHWVERWSE